MSIVRLQVGSIVPEAPTDGEIPKELERRALLVYTGTFQSMDGQVEVQDEHIERLATNHNTFLKKVMTGLGGDLPLKFCPPLQLDHSLSAKDTVGRLVGLVELGEYSEDGQIKKALYGKVKILGKENVEKVMDGRWTNLSIGADLEDGKFQELTITPFPAADGASLLSRGGAKKLSQAEYRSLFEKAVNSVPGVRPTQVDVSETGAKAYYGDEGRAKAAQAELKKIDGLKAVEVKQEADTLWVVECKFEPVDGVKLAMLYKEIKYKGAVIYVNRYFNGDYEAHVHQSYLPSAPHFMGKDLGKVIDDAEKAIDDYLKKTGKTKFSQGDSMLEKLKAYLTGFMRLSAEDAEKKLAEMPEEDQKKLMSEAEAAQAKRDRMKGYLMANKDMDEESAEKHLTEVSQEDLKKLEAEVDEHEKLAAEEEEKKAALSKENSEKLTKLSQGVSARLAGIKLAAKESKITARLSGLKASMKITPAEIKKIDIKRLAKENEATVEAVLKSYESREPVIMTGVLGTTETINMAKAEKARLSALMEKDIMSSMPFTSRLRKASLQEGEQEGASDKVEIHVDTDPHTDLMGEYNELCKMMDEGKLNEVKERLKKRYMANTPSYGTSLQEDAGAVHERMSKLEEEIITLQNEYEEMTKLTAAMRE